LARALRYKNNNDKGGNTMKRYVASLLAALAALPGCSSTVVVPVPPRMELKGYGTLGIVQFSSNSDVAVDVLATRQFQEQVQAAQPGTRFIELGSREALLSAVGGKQLDADAARRIGARYGVAALFVGDIVYAEPKADIRVHDIARLDGAVRAEIRGDISARLIETASGASVWSSSAWARRQIGGVRVSADHGVSAAVSGKADPRRDMVPALVFQLTHDFRPSSARQPAK
jgi:hypothetical protein